jgi:hypothetical protein
MNFGNDAEKQALTSVIAQAHASCPSKGKRVIVQYSKKHKGKEGAVFWHGRDKFSGRQYGGDMSLMLSDICGTIGFRVGVLTDSGEKFFISAENVVVL